MKCRRQLTASPLAGHRLASFQQLMAEPAGAAPSPALTQAQCRGSRLSRSRSQTMNGYKGDYPCDLGCDSDSDVSEVSMLVQTQASAKPVSMRSKVKLVVGAGLCEVGSLTPSDRSVAVCLPGLRATRQEVTRQRRLAADSAAVEAKPGQLRGRRWGVHQRLVFTRRQRTTAGMLLHAMPLSACVASCRRFSIAEGLYCSCILNPRRCSSAQRRSQRSQSVAPQWNMMQTRSRQS
jgi:hypothetical protein